MPESVLDSVRSLLPSWSLWAGPTLYLALIGVFAVVTQLVLRPGHFKVMEEKGHHWSERARRAWGRRILGSQIVWTTGLATAFFGAQTIGPLSLWTKPLFVGVVILLLYVSLVFFGHAFERLVHGDWLTFARYLNGRLSLLLVRFGGIPVAILLGAVLPAEWSIASAIAAFLGLALLYWLSSGGGFRIARALGLATPADGELQALVDQAAAEVGHRGCKAFVLEGIGANAYALHTVLAVLFSKRSLECLSPDQLRSIAHHEFGHLVENRAMLILRHVPIVFLAVCALWNPLMQSYGLMGFLLILVASFVILMFVSARMITSEEQADGHAHRAGDQTVYASALQRIHEVNLIPAVIDSRNKTHPDLYDRLEEAGFTPDYERPGPPELYRRTSLIHILVIIVALGAVEVVRETVVRDNARPHWSVALDPAPVAALQSLAEQKGAGAERESIDFLTAADHLSRGRRVDLPARIALLHVDLDEVDKAKAMYAEAKARRDQRIRVPDEIENLLRRAREAVGAD